MIAALAGVVAEVSATAAVVDVGGVGFAITCPPATLARLTVGERAHLATYLAVREDALTLYGFATTEERSEFLLVQSVTGVGPKIALAVVATLTPGALRQAILGAKLVALTAVPGVGQKMAQRLVLELKDKVMGLTDATMAATESGPSPYREQVIEGLTNLGYSVREATAAWESVEGVAEPTGGVAALMKAALQSLARN